MPISNVITPTAMFPGELDSPNLPIATMSPHVPKFGIPIVWMMLAPNWAKKTTKNTIKLKELSDLKALYTGLNQQTYEAGVNKMQYKIDNPNMDPIPAWMNKARQPRTFKRYISV